MVRCIGPRLKIIRRLGLLPGLTQKQIKNREKTPGEHGKLVYSNTKRSSISDDYRNRLIEKQKLRFNYGITEKQLISYYNTAKKRKGSTGITLLELLESRLDCVIYRLGFAPTIPAARQLITHGHICVNNYKVNIPSFICRSNDLISISENSGSKNLIISSFIKQNKKRKFLLQKIKSINLTKSQFYSFLPNHLEIDDQTMVAKYKFPVNRKDILIRINELKVVEYYSK
jgi:small subunit ribosomal protein S4